MFPAAMAAGHDRRGPARGLLRPHQRGLVERDREGLGQAPLHLGPDAKLASSRTASGTGTMAAISSAISVTPVQASSVVCFRPVSPATQ